MLTACGGGAGLDSPSAAEASAPVDTTAPIDTTIGPESDEPEQPAEVGDPATAAAVDAAFADAEFTALQPLAHEPETAWDSLESRLDADGAVPKDVALEAFALVYGPIPGVSAPPGEPGVTSGTEARRWVMRWYDELSPEQQAAVDAALLPLDASGRPPEEWVEEPAVTDDELASAGHPTDQQAERAALVAGRTNPATAGGVQGGSPEWRVSATQKRELLGAGPTQPALGRPVALEFVPSCWASGPAAKGDAPGVEPYRKVIEEELALLETRLGPLGIPVYLSYGRGTVFADAAAENDDCSQPASWCAIRIMPALARNPGPEVRATLAHELVHCYQGRVVGIETSQDRPSWLIEGFAEFVANTLHPGESPSSARFLETYFNTPASGLFPRSYSAAGFFHHVASTGGDPFKTFAKAMAQDDQMAQFLAHVGGSGRQVFSETWASSMARDETRGAAWEEHAPEVPELTPSVATTPLSNGGSFLLGAVAAGTNLHYVPLSADVVLFRTETGTIGRASWDGSRESALDGLEDAYCNLAQGCECPDEGGPLEPSRTPAAAVMLAVNGVESPGVLRMIGMSLDDWCDGHDPDDTNDTLANAPVDPCLIGTWTSDSWTVAGPIPELDQVGGDGAIVAVEADGTIAWDFDPMQPLTRYDEFIDTTFSSVSSGVAAGTVVALDGTWTVQADLSGVEGQVLTDGPIASTPAGAGPAAYVLVLDGAYSCTGDVLRYTTTDPAFGTPVELSFHRAG